MKTVYLLIDDGDKLCMKDATVAREELSQAGYFVEVGYATPMIRPELRVDTSPRYRGLREIREFIKTSPSS